MRTIRIILFPVLLSLCIGILSSCIETGPSNQIKETNALGQTISFEYDALGQLTKTIHADGSSSKVSYDENGNMISITNEEDETDHYTFDARDQLASFTNAENETTKR